MSRSTHGFLLLAVSLLAVFIAVACGIDSLIYISASPTVVDSNTKNIMFRMPSSTSDAESYLGVELYYRLYATSEAASADRTAITALQDLDTYLPGSEVRTHLVSTSALYYTKPQLESVNSEPSIADDLAPPGSLITIEFPSTLTSDPTVSILDATTRTVLESFTVSRSIRDDSDEYVSFFSEPARGDIDFEYVTTDTDTQTYYAQFYAASYGMDFSSLEELYGEAVFLGSIVLDLFE